MGIDVKITPAPKTHLEFLLGIIQKDIQEDRIADAANHTAHLLETLKPINPTLTLTWESVKTARRHLEDQIRKDCARLEAAGADPEEIHQALESCRAWWAGELQDVG